MIKDRSQAGNLLADKLGDVKDGLILAIPRGGLVVADQIADKLGCKLDVVISKKVTPPEYSEFAIGSIIHDGTLFKGEHWDKFSSHPNFSQELLKKKEEVKRRLEEFRGSSTYDLKEKTVIVVDDGIATGATVYAILSWLRKQGPNKIILAVPVLPASIYDTIKSQVSKLVTLEAPSEFSSVGQFYQNFDQISEEQAKKIINKHQD